MESKKINQLATNVSPQTSDLTIIGDPTTGVSKKITLLQIANLFATTGTVTSVGVTETGDALTITGSPITTAGTINIGFAGAATQYVRGDGALADFPTSTGGGSSVSYYLNSSVSQGTIGGVAYRQLSKTPISGAGTDITASTNGYIASYITDANDPALLEVPAGNFNCEFYFSVNSNAHNPNVYAELYKYDGTTFTLLGSNEAIPEYLTNGTTLSAYYFAIPVATAALTITDRLAIRIYANVDGRVVTLHTENNHLCQVVTTFSKGLISLNNLTRQNQFFGTGTSGTDFNISSTTATHTFNIPDASATNRGLITTGSQTIAGLKSFNDAITGNSGIAFLNGVMPPITSSYYSGIGGNSQGISIVTRPVSTNYTNNLYFPSASNSYTFPNATGTIALTSDLTSGTVTSVAALTLGTTGTDLSSTVANGTTTPVITLNVPTASATNRGALSSADWSTFNGKYNLPSLTSGSVLFSNGTTISQNNSNFFWDNTNVRLGIGTASPSAGVTVYSTTAATQFKAAGTAPAFTFSDTLVSSTYACVFGLATLANHFVTGTATGDMAIANQSTSAGAIVFGTGTTEKMRMTSTGKLSIGNTNDTYTLDVSGTGRFTNFLKVSGNNALGASSIGGMEMAYFGAEAKSRIIIGDGTGYSLSFSKRTGSANTDLFTITDAGAATFSSSVTSTQLKAESSLNGDPELATFTNSNAGTGTEATIYVRNSSSNNDGTFIQALGTAFTTTGGFVQDGGVIGTGTGLSGGLSLMVRANADMRFYTNGHTNERMRITSGGALAINQSSGVVNTLFKIRGVDQSSSNYSVIMDNAVTDLFYIRNDGLISVGLAGNSPYNLVRSGRVMMVDSNGLVGYQSSTRESKTNINNLTDISFLYQLNPVSFNYRKSEGESNIFTNEYNQDLHYGLIADEVEKVNKELVFYNDKDGVKELAGVEYGKLTAVLIKAIQELSAQNQDLKSRLDKAGL